LGAGSVGSPAILMRSGMAKQLKDPKNNALHLTDHNLCGKALAFHYLDPSIREKVGSMKLQSYVRLKSGTIAFVNIAVDSSSFLPREFLPSQFFRNENFPRLGVVFIIPTELNDKNTMDLDYKGEPVLTAGREGPLTNDVAELRELTKKAISTIKEVLDIEIRPDDKIMDDDNFLTTFPLGADGHEMGTIPLKCHDNGKQYHVEDDLRLRTREGVYVCDLSIFPFSPEVNPTLTLVALALRLSKTILNPIPPTPPDDTVCIMNQTGEPIKVYVSNRAGVTLTDEEIDENKECKILCPGEVVKRKRRGGVDESVMVYRLDYNTDTVYLPTPVPYIATPGRICVVE